MEEDKKEDIREEGPAGEDIELEQESFLQSRTFRTILWAVGIVFLMLVAFKGGEFVESQKADSAYRWSQNYYPNFVGRPSGPIGFGGSNFMMSHGVFGPIISINDPSLVVQDTNSNIERSVMTSTGTLIKDLNSNIPFSGLRVNEQVIVIGSPDQSGQIDAQLIRVIPMPSSLPQ